MSLNHQTLERILQLLSAGKDYCIETYDHAIDLFLTEFPDDTVKKSTVANLSLPSVSKFSESEEEM